MHGGQRGDHAVHDALKNFVAFGVENGRVGHQVAHIAHKQQAATMQTEFAAIGCGIEAVAVECACDGLATLLQSSGQVTLHQSQPVAVDLDLVLGVHGCDGVFAIHDGRHGRLHQQVFHACGIGLTDGAVCINLNLDVQAVVLEQHRSGCFGGAVVANETLWLRQGDGFALGRRDRERSIDDAVGR